MPHPRSLTLPLLALLLSFPAPFAALADEPTPLTDEQRQELQAEAARLWKAAQAFDKEGKLAEALAAGEKMLAADRGLLGNQHEDIAFDLGWLAERYELRENFAAATKHRAEVVAIQTHRLGKDHWQVIDARWARKDADSLARFSSEQRGQFHLARARNRDAVRLHGEGEVVEAIRAASEGTSLTKTILGEAHPNYATGLGNLASLYVTQGDFARAELLHRKTLEITKNVLGEAHPSYATSLSNLAFLYESQGAFARAEPFCRQALEITKKVLGEAHSDYSFRLDKLAGVYISQKDYVRAEPLYRQALEIARARGEAHPDYSASFHRLASLYYLQGDYARAEPLYRQALETRTKVLGELHELTQKTRAMLIACLQDRAAQAEQEADFIAARKYRSEVLDLQSRCQGKDHWEVTDARLALQHTNLIASLTAAQRKQLQRAEERNGEGVHLIDQGELATALVPVREALEIRKAILGEAHPAYATSLNNLAWLYQGDYARAEPLYRQALDINRTALGEAHPQFATSLNNLAILYKSQGDYARAESLYRQASEISRTALGEVHPEYAKSLNNLAVLYDSQGDHARAEPLYRQANEVLKKALGEAHPDYATGLNNLATLYQAQGDYARAEPLVRQAREIARKAQGEAHPSYAISLNNLGALYQRQGDRARAEPLYRQANEVLKRALGEAHPDYAASLNNLANLYQSQGDYARAEPLYRQASEINRAALGEVHPDYATNLNNLAGLYQIQGDDARAEPLYRQANEILKKSLGEAHPDYATSLNNLGWLYASQGDYARAESLYRQALEISLANLELVAAVQSERGQFAMTANMRHRLDNYLTLAIRAGDFHLAVYDRLLAWKGMVLARQQGMRVVGGQPDLAPVASELQTTTRRLASLALATPQPEQAETWRLQIAELSVRKESLEQKLAAGSAEFRSAIKPTTVADLRVALPADGAVVDFLEFSYSEPKTKEDGGGRKWERRIAAFVVVKEGDVQLVDLGPATPIIEAIDAWRGGFGLNAESRTAGELLREKLWLPIEKHLAGATTVLISPDGELGKLPFAALPGKQPGTYLVEEYTLAVVSSARVIVDSARQAEQDVARPASESDPAGLAESTGNLLVLGGVDYDRRGDADPAAAEADPPKRIFAARAVRDEADQPFVPLAGTKGELATIDRLYRKTFGADGIRSLEGSAATQDAFIAAACNHLYLHLATHGYFASPKYKSALDRSAQDMTRGGEAFVSNQSLAGYHPGLLSGIALAGANQPTEEDDGIVTAEEIGSLNLDRCELVVLSACETGLGQAAGGEGLLGVQRAFQAAGAKTVIASLWKVDDNATRDLMERFYENLWTKTKADGKPYTKLGALREAQLWMLKERGPRGIVDAEGKPADAKEKRLPPYFWAAFVLSGDWR